MNITMSTNNAFSGSSAFAINEVAQVVTHPPLAALFRTADLAAEEIEESRLLVGTNSPFNINSNCNNRRDNYQMFLALI